MCVCRSRSSTAPTAPTPSDEALLADVVGLALLVVLDAFLAAAREGDFEALLEVLDPEVVLRADPGAVSLGASRVVRGAADVARQALAFSRLGVEGRRALVNGAVGTVSLRDGRPFAIAGFTIRDRRIVEMDVVADPELLGRLDLTILD